MTEIPTNQFIAPFIVPHRKLFTTIVTTCSTMDGWSTPEKCCTIASLILTNKPDIGCEIGVWSGRSLLPAAMAMKENGKGKIIGIDAWDAQISAQDEIPDSHDWWAAQDHAAIHKKAVFFVGMAGVTKHVELIKKKSSDVEHPKNIGYLHIDGQHMGQAVNDAERFCPNVSVGGFLIVYHLHWVGGAPLRAMDVAETIGFVEIFRLVDNVGNDWVLLQ